MVREREAMVSCCFEMMETRSEETSILRSPLLALDCGAVAIATFLELFFLNISPFPTRTQSGESIGYAIKILLKISELKLDFKFETPKLDGFTEIFLQNSLILIC